MLDFVPLCFIRIDNLAATLQLGKYCHKICKGIRSRKKREREKEIETERKREGDRDGKKERTKRNTITFQLPTITLATKKTLQQTFKKTVKNKNVVET